MSSKAITEKPDREPVGEWHPTLELAPSQTQADEPTLARWIGLLGLGLFTLGVAAHLFSHLDWKIRIDTAWGTLLAILGAGLMLFHATSDGDIQVRRTYGLFGYVWLALAIVVSLLPIGGEVGSLFLPYGALGFAMALLFLLPFVHHETDTAWRGPTIMVLGIVGGVLGVTGLLGGNFSNAFLVPQGLIFSLLGLVYLWAFISMRGGDDAISHRVGLGMAVAGFLVFLWAFTLWLGPEIGYRLGWAGRPSGNYFADAGFLVLILGFAYIGTALMLTSDRQLMVLTRRELASFFYSPIAYLVLAGFFLIASYRYSEFARDLTRMSEQGVGMMHLPFYYVLNIFPVIVQVLAVPLLTMRLFSEERRSGTYEVLVTAPVADGPIVLSKFLAALIVFLFTWLPFGLYLVALRVQGGSFDYHPVLSFILALICTGANFVAMGMFFSSVTRNQIAAGVLTAGAMALQIAMYFLKGAFLAGSIWPEVIRHISFIDLWSTTLQGRIPVGDLVLQLSFAVFWLFLTAKVIEARKWS